VAARVALKGRALTLQLRIEYLRHSFHRRLEVLEIRRHKVVAIALFRLWRVKLWEYQQIDFGAQSFQTRNCHLIVSMETINRQVLSNPYRRFVNETKTSTGLGSFCSEENGFTVAQAKRKYFQHVGKECDKSNFVYSP
jgi:hypothetical protein